MKHSRTNSAFILYAIDVDLLYPYLGVRFEVDDLTELRRFLSIDEEDDPDFNMQYTLDAHEAASLCSAFNIAFDCGRGPVTLHRHDEKSDQPPYLFHTGYELPLLLQGRKKLARMFFDDHPRSRELKTRFDHYVAEGLLQVVEEDAGVSPRGDRFVVAFYTPKGEKWRIRALKLILRCSKQSGGWNEHFERLEGMLMGYDDWQNDWWLERNANGDGMMFGMPFHAAVTKAGLEWIEHAGLQALPPVDGNLFIVSPSYALDDDTMQFALRDNPHIEAFVQFNIRAKHLMDVADLRTAGPYVLPASIIPEINRNLARSVRIIVQRPGSDNSFGN